MRKFEESGGLYRWSFAELISEDGWNLAMSDAVMVGSTLLCVPFVKVSLESCASLVASINELTRASRV